jgi:hypothetical protein
LTGTFTVMSCGLVITKVLVDCPLKEIVFTLAKFDPTKLTVVPATPPLG